MEIIENKNNKIVLGNEGYYYLISYESVIAKMSKKEFYLTDKWDYSITTLKQLYDFIELYNYDIKLIMELKKSKNKKEFINNLIKNGTIKIVSSYEI